MLVILLEEYCRGETSESSSAKQRVLSIGIFAYPLLLLYLRPFPNFHSDFEVHGDKVLCCYVCYHWPK